MPTARGGGEVGSRRAAPFGKTLDAQPEVQATLLGVIGRVYRNLGLYQQATPLVEAALSARRQSLGPEHAEVAAVMSDLGELLRLKGEYKAAEQTLREAGALQRRLGAGAGRLPGSISYICR